MWILEISLGGREILRQPVRGRSNLIGRSPSCDIVLRSPGIQPVHFLLEWIGEGAPVPGEGDWTLSDIHTEGHEAAEETAADESGMGVLLTRENVVLSGYAFKWIFDSLAETDIQKGVLSEKLRQAVDGESDAAFFFSDSQILEVVTVDTTRNKVTDIQHIKLQKFNNGYSTLPLEPNILFHTPMEARAHVDLAMIPDAKAFLRGYTIRHDDLKQTVLGPNDLLQIKWKMQDYYLRMVPEVKAPKAPIQFYRERFNQVCAAALLALVAVIVMINMSYKPAVLEEVVPPRIAQVSVREMRPLPPPPAEPAPLAPEIVPEPLPSEPVPVTSPQVKLKQAETAAPKPVTKNPKPSVPAPKGPVTSMGLLGNLKGSKDAPKVRADKMINQGLSADSAGGDDGFVVRQAPQGQLANKDAAGSGLASASSEVGGSVRGETNSFGAANTEVKELPRLGARAEKAREARDGAGGGSGLTRDVVRTRIRDYQKDVRACYERALLTKPKIQGRIQYQWTITPQGKTSRLRMLSSQVQSPALERCVFGIIQGITWPVAASGRPTNISYPFEFQAKN